LAAKRSKCLLRKQLRKRKLKQRRRMIWQSGLKKRKKKKMIKTRN
jgi:hypothetical protein